MTTFSRIQLLGAGAIVFITVAALWWMLGLKTYQTLLPLAEGDTVSSWNFVGAYTNNPELQEKAHVEIERLTKLVGNSKEYTDYQLNIATAAQYELMGDGAKAYEYLNRAAAIDPVHTGLAWANLGELMERLGAFQTARVAYAKAVEAQPSISGYHAARLTFLTQHFAMDTVAVEGAFSEAKTHFGDSPQILQIKAQWFASTGKIAEAIDTWKKVSSMIGVQPGIDKEIKRLQAKL